VHDVAPIIRLVAARATGRMIPYLDLALDQLFERLRDPPFLIALNARSQRGDFSYCFQPHLDVNRLANLTPSASNLTPFCGGVCW
jgi:hypothetical protein